MPLVWWVAGSDSPDALVDWVDLVTFHQSDIKELVRRTPPSLCFSPPSVSVRTRPYLNWAWCVAIMPVSPADG